MSVLTSPAPPRPSLPRRLLGDASGATAVEFGLVAVPFLALLGAIIQVAFMIWAQQNFDFVFQRTARTLFTGQFQQSNDETATANVLIAALKKQMCGSGTTATPTLFNCSQVVIDITIGKNFTSSTPSYPIDPATRDWSPSFGGHYTCAAPGSILIATAAVKFPVFFGKLNSVFANFYDGSKLLESTAVFRTEPYTSSTNSPCPTTSTGS